MKYKKNMLQMLDYGLVVSSTISTESSSDWLELSKSIIDVSIGIVGLGVSLFIILFCGDFTVLKAGKDCFFLGSGISNTSLSESEER